jgi:uroporphyrinogen III methyltransferase / synthase
VRLKGGDPAVFAHLGEELDALSAAGVDYEVVPGITAALAVGSHAGVMLTHRDKASAVALVTGREQAGKEESAIDYAALARFPGTLVFYMGVTSAEVWAQSLIDAGKSPDTPAKIIRRCSWPDQQVFECKLGTVVSTITEQRVRPPVVVVVGDAAAAELSGFVRSSGPLSGRKILVTRPEGQNGEMAEALEELGAQVLLQPAIEIKPPRDWSPVDRAIAELTKFDWVVFSSTNGVQAFLDRVFTCGRDVRALGHARLAAIGPGTARALSHYHLTPDAMPEEFRAESLTRALKDAAAGKRFLLIRASRGREILAEELSAAGGQVTQVVVYESHDVQAPDAEIHKLLQAGQIDWVTVTSSAIARSLDRMFGSALQRTKLASISPVATATLLELNFSVAAEAVEYTSGGLVAAICKATEC